MQVIFKKGIKNRGKVLKMGEVTLKENLFRKTKNSTPEKFQLQIVLVYILKLCIPSYNIGGELKICVVFCAALVKDALKWEAHKKSISVFICITL